MADEPISIKAEFDDNGAVAKIEDLSQAVGGLGQSASQTETQTDAATLSIQQMGNGTTSASQKIQGITGAVQGLLGQLGSSNRTAGLISSVAGATAQFSAMGATLGPGGALIGGLAGLATSLYAVVNANNDVEASATRAREALESLASRRISDREREAFDAEIGGGAISGLRSGADIELAAETRRVRREEIEAEFRDTDERIARARAALGGAGRDLSEDFRRNLNSERDALRAEYRALGSEVETLEGELARRQAVARERERASAAAGASGGGGRSAEEAMRDQGTQGGRGGDRADFIRDSGAQEIDARIELNERIAELEREADDARKAEELEKERQFQEDLAAIEIEAMNQRKELAVAEFERQQAMDERALESREQAGKEIAGLFSQTTSALTDTLKSIATGEKSAEEAFKGLAAAFLEMISQYASLKAATEFADAAASFARYDFGGGAAHIGAGLAFTAVAVATGVGAALINQPPQAPARPEAVNTDAGSGRGGDVIVNFNSPVVTAGTRAELGREINTLAGEGASI